MCSGEGSRFLRGGGVGERSFCLKKVKILPCFFFCGVALEPCAGAVSMGISSSVDGGDESEESESTMLGVVVVVAGGGPWLRLRTREALRRSTAWNV
jgi:hypothetical protein